MTRACTRVYYMSMSMRYELLVLVLVLARVCMSYYDSISMTRSLGVYELCMSYDPSFLIIATHAAAAGWPARWLTCWLIGWLAGWLAGWLTGWLGDAAIMIYTTTYSFLRLSIASLYGFGPVYTILVYGSGSFDIVVKSWSCWFLILSFFFFTTVRRARFIWFLSKCPISYCSSFLDFSVCTPWAGCDNKTKSTRISKSCIAYSSSCVHKRGISFSSCVWKNYGLLFVFLQKMGEKYVEGIQKSAARTIFG